MPHRQLSSNVDSGAATATTSGITRETGTGDCADPPELDSPLLLTFGAR